MKAFAIASLLCLTAFANADERPAENVFHEQLGIAFDQIYVVSPFDEVTYFTAYSLAGDMLWEIPFISKILSWKVKEGLVFIFSQDLDGLCYYLNCLDASEGTLLWGRKILAPTPSP